MSTTDIIVKVIKYMLILGPSIFSTHTWLYMKNPKYYFMVIRLLSKWRDTNWSINIKYELPDLNDSYRKIESTLRVRFGEQKYKREVNMVNKKLYKCDGFNMLIRDDFSDGDFSTNSLYISISELNVTLNTAEEKLRLFRELFNEIQRELSPTDAGYNLDVYFKNGKNPFYGLMVQRLGKEKVNYFECSFPIDAIVPKVADRGDRSHLLRIFKEKLTINDNSFDILEETAKRALLFK
ncbi:hypothetical protein NSQ91_14225 [Paenibacillus sp. FSL R7-0048]|uniref:hypothetical protein n=1 Tax=Paenibacillus sp. FSL R7-0048 TaxID=2954528 RepID=UPI0030FB22FE